MSSTSANKECGEVNEVDHIICNCKSVGSSRAVVTIIIKINKT